MVKQNFLTKMLLLCALIVGSVSSAWAEEVTYTVGSKGTVTVTGTAPSGSSLNFTNTYTTDYRQMTAGNSQTWSYNGFSGLHITKLVLSMKSNSSKGAGSLSYSIDGGENFTFIVNDNSFNSSDWHGSWSTSFVDIVKVVDINVGEDDFVLKLTSSQNSIYCTSIKITYEEISETTEWTVSYDGNGATSGIEPTDATVYDEDNNEVTVLGNTGNLAKTGYTFSGWNTQSDGEGTTYVAGNTFTISANTTLYAKWTVNSYNVTLPTADAYGTYTMSATNPVAYGTEVTLTYTPADGYENYQATWSVNGTAISGDSFTMPDEVVIVTVKVEEEKDYATLPFNWEGGASADLKALNGVTVNADNKDYAEENAPYLVKFNGTGKYITIKTDCQPGQLFIDIKKIGGGNTSTLTIQESVDGNTYTDVENLYTVGSNNAIVNLNTTKMFKSSTRYVRIYFLKDYNGTTGSNIGVGPITITKTETVSIPSSGYGTYCSAHALDFSATDIEAYTAAYSYESGKVVLTKIGDGIVPANTGVVLYGTPSSEQAVPVTVTDKTTLEGNEMVGVTAQTTVNWTSDSKCNYILQQGKFFKATGAAIRANRAYLHTTYDVSTSGAPELDLAFGDETTGIQNIERTVNDNQYYTLDGRRVAEPTKGLYIVNGKKVVIK